MVSPLAEPLDPSTVTEILLGGEWVGVQPGSFRVGTLRIGSGGASGESIRNDIWWSAELADGGRCSGPFGAIQAVRH